MPVSWTQPTAATAMREYDEGIARIRDDQVSFDRGAMSDGHFYFSGH